MQLEMCAVIWYCFPPCE